MNSIYNMIEKGKDIVNTRIVSDIQRNRKGNFELIFRDKSGEKLENIDIKIDLEQIDFNFGANIFMLGEYDEKERNKNYESLFCNLFNSATIPLYWEGTEPVKDYLRYDKGTKRDIYRRPPASETVEFCKENNIRMKGHPLFWHEFVPRWLPQNYQDLKPYIEKRFIEISERYKDDIECFDVVNEPSRVYDVYMRDRCTGRPYILPEKDYCLWIFDLALKHFPSNKLIINDTVGASFTEFRGEYSGYYLNVKDLLSRGAKIDEIGLQCHCGEWGPENVYDAERLCDVLDTYAALGRTINISEISIPSKFNGEKDEELQSLLAEQLYKVCFSHESVSGITWWNMTDDGILTTKRVAENENMPSTGLVDENYNPKIAYKTLDRLINKEWKTNIELSSSEGNVRFNGFYGKYKLKIKHNGKTIEKTIKLTKNSSRIMNINIDE